MAYYSVWKHDYDDEWIRKNYTGKCTKEFHKRYVEETGHEVLQTTLRHHIRRQLGIKSFGYYYTDEEVEFVKNNYGMLGAKACAEQMNCDINRVYGIAHCALGIKMTKEEFKKHVNVFEARYPTWTIKPAKADCSEYVIKTDNGWEHLGRYVWEQHYGSVPDGHYVVFLNRDPSDARIENLMAVPKGVVGGMNYADLWSENPQITKARLMVQVLQRLMKMEEFE